MFKFLLVLSVGIAIGYGYGWKDAHVHDLHVVERLIGQIGGASRSLVSGDIDAQMEKAEKR